jgi:hypothetical protein
MSTTLPEGRAWKKQWSDEGRKVIDTSRRGRMETVPRWWLSALMSRTKTGLTKTRGSVVDRAKKARQERQDRFDEGKREVAITSRSHASRRMCSR